MENYAYKNYSENQFILSIIIKIFREFVAIYAFCSIIFLANKFIIMITLV